MLVSQQKSAGTELQISNLVLDSENAILKKGGETFHLTPKESKILAILMKNAGEIVSRDRLMKEVWYSDKFNGSRTLDVHIRWLRQKIEDNPNIPEYILTRRGLGYEFRNIQR